MKRHLSAAALIGMVADDGSFDPWDEDVVSDDPLGFVDTMPYRERLRLTTERSGVSEAVVTGRARIDGRDVVLIAGEFAFLAGTLGVAAAERVVRAFERATELRLPVIGMPISGGTRMQEGTAAFVQMTSCAAAVRRFRDAGLLYIAYLRHPTLGGVLASWASLAHVRLAEPGALIGLTGPRVVKAMTGTPFPEGVQVAEHLADHGIVDDVAAPADLRDRLRDVLESSDPTERAWRPDAPAEVLPDDARVAAWDAVEQSRRPERFTVHDVLAACGADGVGLRGDGAGGVDQGCITRLGRVCGTAAVILAQDRTVDGRGASIGAAGYRQYVRGIELAEELRLPVVTFIDTRGAAISRHDEETGLAAAIADCLAALSAVRVPTLSVLLGEGAGGGAIALLPGDAVVAAEHSWLAPIAPEGASAILHRTPDRAAEVATSQSIVSTQLRRLGIVDAVVADADPQAATRVAAVVGEHLRQLCATTTQDRLDARVRRYRNLARAR